MDRGTGSKGLTWATLDQSLGLPEGTAAGDFAKTSYGETRQQEISRLQAIYGLSRAGHSLFSPSSSAGWMNCAGFLLANAKRGDMAGIDAAYGTVGHEIAAEWLTVIRDKGKKAGELVPVTYLGAEKMENGFRIKCDENMIYHIQRYIDYCAEVELLGDVHIEQRVTYPGYTPIPDQGGTADHFVCGFGWCIITDLKLGMLRVDVTDNSQALLYALGVYLEWNWLYGFKKFTIRIAQPRLDSFTSQDYTVEQLLAFGEQVKITSDAAWHEDAPRTPGPKQCQWCNVVGCPAQSALLEDMADEVFDYDVEESTKEISRSYDMKALDDHAMAPLFGAPREPYFHVRMETSLMAWRYKHRSMFEKWFRLMGVELTKRAQAGQHVPGFKLGSGRRKFGWYDPDYAAQELMAQGLAESDIYTTEVTSVNKISQALRSKAEMKPKEIERLLFEVPEDDPDRLPLVMTTPGRTTLVPLNDPRYDVRDAIDDALMDDDEAEQEFNDDEL